EIRGVSSGAGYIWVLDARSAQLTAKIPVGPTPLSIDFSPAYDRVFTTSSGSDQLLAIDCASRAIIGRARTGSEPVQARITQDNKTIHDVNPRSSTLSIHDAATLQLHASVNVIPQPDE